MRKPIFSLETMAQDYQNAMRNNVAILETQQLDHENDPIVLQSKTEQINEAEDISKTITNLEETVGHFVQNVTPYSVDAAEVVQVTFESFRKRLGFKLPISPALEQYKRSSSKKMQLAVAHEEMKTFNTRLKASIAAARAEMISVAQ